MISNKEKNNSIGLTTILFLIFLVMKLGKIGDVANWSWWWVTSPLWIPITLILAILTIVFTPILVILFIKYIYLKIK
jgi:hypothetical protein